MSDIVELRNTSLLDLTTEIVAAYVGHNAASQRDLLQLIAETHAALRALDKSPNLEPDLELKPAVPIRKSVTPEFIVCLEDGKRFKSLKRHLASHFELTPDEYRAKWGLPADYPMTAPNYSARRSALARQNGLGRKAAPSPLEPASANSRKKSGSKS